MTVVVTAAVAVVAAAAASIAAAAAAVVVAAAAAAATATTVVVTVVARFLLGTLLRLFLSFLRIIFPKFFGQSRIGADTCLLSLEDPFRDETFLVFF